MNNIQNTSNKSVLEIIGRISGTIALPFLALLIASLYLPGWQIWTNRLAVAVLFTGGVFQILEMGIRPILKKQEAGSVPLKTIKKLTAIIHLFLGIVCIFFGILLLAALLMT